MYASSSSVYGDRPELPKREDQPPAPISPYAVSKAAGEQYAAVWNRLYGVETVGPALLQRVRPAPGPRERVRGGDPALHPVGADAAQPLEVHGDGTQSRDFTYIDNVVEANLLAAARARRRPGRSSTWAAASRMSLLEIIARAGGAARPAAPAPPHAVAGRRRAAHPGRRRPRPSG